MFWQLWLLGEAGANINTRSKNDWTILHEAAGSGQTEIFEWLLSLGADFLASDKRGWTPLHAAARKDLKTAKVLKEMGADIHARNKDG